MDSPFKPRHKDLYDTLMKYVESLNIPLGTNFLNARNHVESVKEEDDKILSLGMPMHPIEKEIEEKEEKVEEEWSSYPSPTPNKGNTQIPMNNSFYNDNDLPSSPLCGSIVSNIWEDESDILELDDPLCSLDDLSLCGESIQNYVVKFTYDACKHYEGGRDNSPLYVSTLFKMQATENYMHWIPQTCYYLFIYKMPMHRKKVRLKMLMSMCFVVCSICFNVLFSLSTPLYPYNM